MKTDDAVGSHPEDQLVLVDSEDRVIGYRPKSACHRGDGILHRAFSIFVFDRSGRLILQKRAAGKPLWPLHWSNTCCSHPRLGEAMHDALHRRLREELNFDCDLDYLFKFEYRARYRDYGSEHELCHVFAGCYDGRIDANPVEVAELRYVSADVVDEELVRSPGEFTPWFRLEWPRVRSELNQGRLLPCSGQ